MAYLFNLWCSLPWKPVEKEGDEFRRYCRGPECVVQKLRGTRTVHVISFELFFPWFIFDAFIENRTNSKNKSPTEEFCTGACFSENFSGRAGKAMTKSRTSRLQSCFIHAFLIWKEVPFIQEVSGVYTSPLLDTDRVMGSWYRWTRNGFTGAKSFRGFRETGPRPANDPRNRFHHEKLGMAWTP